MLGTILFVIIVLGICAFIAIVVVVKKVTKEKLDKSEADFLAITNKENNTNFRSDRKITTPGMLGTTIYFDMDKHKLYFLKGKGIEGIKDYDIIREWVLYDSPNHHIALSLRDIDKPLLKIIFLNRKEAQEQFARLSALLKI